MLSSEKLVLVNLQVSIKQQKGRLFVWLSERLFRILYFLNEIEVIWHVSEETEWRGEDTWFGNECAK